MTTVDVEYPSTDDPTSITDWLEAVLILSGQEHASSTWIRQQLKSTLFPTSEMGPEDLDPDDMDVAIEGVLSEIHRRRTAVGEAYPFSPDDIDSGVAVSMDKQHLPYAFMLLISVSRKLRTQKRQREVEKPFEELVVDAVSAYLGANARAIRFGSPATGARPKNFRVALEWLATELGIPRGLAKAGSSSGDRGLDVIGWIPFPDRRPGFIAVLAQCTIEKHWHGKGLDSSGQVWHGYLDFGSSPPTALAIPFAIPVEGHRWDEARRRSTVVFDRLRIARHAQAVRGPVNREIKAWSKREARTLGAKLKTLDWAN